MRYRETIKELRELVGDIDEADKKKPRPAAVLKKARDTVNDALTKNGLDGNSSFKSIGAGMNKIGDALTAGGLELDDVPSADLFRGDNGRRTLRVAWSNPEDSFSPESIDNTMLVIQWNKHASGNYEVTAYLS